MADRLAREREHGDYRLTRARRRLWVVQRTWFGQWRPVAPPAPYDVAHAFFCELTDWQALATPAMREVMRCNVPAMARMPGGGRR